MFAQQNRNNGFTMIETIVALAVLTAAIIGPVSLVVRAIFSSSFSRNNLIGYNLAQEGIELIRAVRDNNIHCKNLGGAPEWSDDPNSLPNNPMHDVYTVDVKDNMAMAAPCVNIQTPRPLSQVPAACDPFFGGGPVITPLGLDGSGVYTNVGSPPATIFTRCVKVCSRPNRPPCSAVEDSGLGTLFVPSDDQMEVISIVWWRERNQTRSVMLHDRLYHWE